MSRRASSSYHLGASLAGPVLAPACVLCVVLAFQPHLSTWMPSYSVRESLIVLVFNTQLHRYYAKSGLAFD